MPLGRHPHGCRPSVVAAQPCTHPAARRRGPYAPAVTTSKIARSWHLLTLTVAVVALLLQLALILRGDNILDSTAAAGRLEQTRRYFSYFTIQSNFLVAVSMVLVVRNRIDAPLFRVVRLASLIGITVTGLVAAVALPPSPNYTTGSLICDRLLHIVVPTLTFVGWVAFGPRGRVGREDLLPTLAWPVTWLACTLALGPFVGWYPYPFLDVDRIGYGSTLLNCALVAVLFLALGALALWADRRLSRERATMSA